MSKISAYTATTSLTDATATFVVVEGGVTKKITAANLAADSVFAQNPKLGTSRFFPAPQHGALSSMAMTLNQIDYIPFDLDGATRTLSEIHFESITGGGAGSVVRFGVFQQSSVGLPSTLIADLGTVASTGTGALGLTGLSTVISPSVGRRVFFGIVPQVGTAPTSVRAATGPVPGVSGGVVLNALRFHSTGYRQTGVTGALATAVPDTTLGVTSVPIVAVVFSA